MKITKLVWKKIDWNAYFGQGYNYVEDSGELYAIDKETAMKYCPIKEKEGKIKIYDIEVKEK